MSESLRNASSRGASGRQGSPRGPRRRWWLVAAGAVAGLLVLLVVAAGLYTRTEDFQRRVGGEVVKVLENATGARVELGHLSFDLWHLAVEVDGLVLHGTEAPGEVPYLSAQRILVRLRIHTFLTHIRGVGPQSRIGLSYLRVEQPVIHLIVDQDGHTNQPVPKHPSPSTEPLQDTLLDLQAGQVEVVQGVALVNDRAVPFNLAARELGVELHYIRSSDRYGATVSMADLATQIARQPEVHSQLQLSVELGRDMVALKRLEFATGARTRVTADGELQHFQAPQWQAEVGGDVDLHQLSLLANVDGLRAGTLNLFLKGHSCAVTPAVAEQHPHFWQRRRSAPSAKVLPPDPNCAQGYLLAGAIRFRGVGYETEYVRVHQVNGSAELHVTPTELLFTALTGQLEGGGGASGQLKIENWLGEESAMASAGPAASATLRGAATTANRVAATAGAAAPVRSPSATPKRPEATAEAYLTVRVDHLSLRSIMDITAPPHYGDLGYDTAITGPVEVTWGGPVTAVSGSVQVQADLEFAPTGRVRPGALSNIPIAGHVLGHYDGSTQVVRVQSLDVHTPATQLRAGGVLGVADGDPLTALQVSLEARDLGEFNQLLQTLGFAANGKTGTAAIPVDLHGTLGFTGTARGALRDLDLKGHLTADDLALQLSSTADVHLDSVVGDAEYSPSAGVAIAQSTLRRGTAVLQVTGKFAPHRRVSRRGVVSYAWDGGTAIDATVKLAEAQAADLLQIAGQQQRVALTGTVALQAKLSGTVQEMTGSGGLQLSHGTVEGEPYQSVGLQVEAAGRELSVSQLQVRAHGDLLTGSGSYNLDSRHLTAKVLAPAVHLERYSRLAEVANGLAGTLSLNATADGTVEQPNLHARVELAGLSVQGKPLGELRATADSAGTRLSYTLQSDAAGAELAASGHTELTGAYPSQAELRVEGLNVATVMAMFAPNAVKVSSNLSAVVSVSGPLAQPRRLAGSAELSNVDLKLEGVELRSAEPVRLALANGTATLQALHITGMDTDLRAAGSVQVFAPGGQADPQGGAIALKASGSVSTALAHTFDADLIAAGKVSFQLNAAGRVHKPDLTGNVLFQNVDLAVDGVPNGLSNMNGTLVFDQDRLEVKDLVATTGGGQLRLGGYLSYQKGLFADLTATGEAVRIRYAGFSATATAHLRMQGGPQAVLLSGNVLVTRFGVGPDVDFAAFAGSGGLSAPPDPNAATNKIRLDVHITSAPQLDFQNSYAKLAGTVDVTARGTLAQPTMLGRIQITDGSATFAGTNYQLQRGTITFANPVRIDPTIDLDATARVENYDITIGLHGTANSIKPTYRSEPPLTEADIFNLLALGRTQEEAQLYQEQQVQAGTDPTTSALLGGALNATVSNRVSKLFGAGSIKIDPAFVGTLGNSSARITVQEPLSKQLTLVFATNVNQTAEQLIQLQYQINQNTSLVATRDESGVFSIVYKIRKRYR